MGVQKKNPLSKRRGRGQSMARMEKFRTHGSRGLLERRIYGGKGRKRHDPGGRRPF